AIASIAAGHMVGPVISAKVIALTEGVLKTMLLKQLKVVAAILLVLGSVVTFGGGRLLTHFAAVAQEIQKPKLENAAAAAHSPKDETQQPKAQPKNNLGPVAAAKQD